MAPDGHRISELAERDALDGLRWLGDQGRAGSVGRRWPATPDDPETWSDLYAGGAGIVLAFLEGHAHTGDDAWAEAALAGARELAVDVDRMDNASMYFGAAGTVFALAAVGDRLDDAPSRVAADRGRARIRSTYDGERWGDAFDLLGGNAGIALAALDLGDLELAVSAVSAYLSAAEVTPFGVTWENRRGMVPRRHHISHGTLGFVLALARVGYAADRTDFIELALRAAADVVARDAEGGPGFLVPHSDPQQAPERVERFSYGWCHGPAGDAQVFRALGRLTGDAAWPSLAQRCWHTVTHSGLPQRLRPGFWDNNGRCCGTAGVLALATDRIAELDDAPDFADLLVTDLHDRAVCDEAGTRWSNLEHRHDPPLLAPRTGWAMGVAGISRELLRFARVRRGEDPTYAVPLPDQMQPGPLRAQPGAGDPPRS